jgi:hypothetical protein
MYLTTKVGDVTVKAGNYATGTSSILGEIDNGSRSNNKVTLTTTLGGATVYVGNAGSSAASTGFTTINNNMFAGVKMDVAGVTVQAKKVSDTVDAFGVSGDMSGVGFRLEQKQGTGSNTDVVFGNVTTDVNGISLGYAWIDADANGLIGEDDSAIFAVENASSGDSNSQFTASTSVQGNKVTLKAGTIGFKDAATLDRDYTQVTVSRPLASGATATATYTDKDTATKVWQFTAFPMTWSGGSLPSGQCCRTSTVSANNLFCWGITSRLICASSRSKSGQPALFSHSRYWIRCCCRRSLIRTRNITVWNRAWPCWESVSNTGTARFQMQRQRHRFF